jgi:hypothetical protein
MAVYRGLPGCDEKEGSAKKQPVVVIADGRLLLNPLLPFVYRRLDHFQSRCISELTISALGGSLIAQQGQI